MVSWFQEGRQKPFSRTVYWKLGDAHHRRGGHVNMHPNPTPVKPKVGVDEQASAAEKADFEQLSVYLQILALDLGIVQVRFNLVEPWLSIVSVCHTVLHVSHGTGELREVELWIIGLNVDEIRMHNETQIQAPQQALKNQFSSWQPGQYTEGKQRSPDSDPALT